MVNANLLGDESQGIVKKKGKEGNRVPF